MITQKTIQQMSYDVMASSIEVHRHLGPGLLESIYQACLVQELTWQHFTVKEQVAIPVVYKGILTKNPLRLDILVNDLIIVEVKSVDRILPIHHAQIITYLKLSGKPKALLINFNATNLTHASKPFVDKTFSSLPLE